MNINFKDGFITESANFSNISDSYDPDLQAAEEVEEYNIKQIFGVIVNIVKKDSYQNLRQRKKYANKIYIMLCIWSIFVSSIILLKGGGFIYLSDNIIITLMTTVFLEIIGLFILVAKYLFKESDQLHLLINNICKDTDIIKSIN
tara:strand:- start:232 stop:666 length:435 start_codon:yes stop_codon:yes gene_type:complete